MSGVQQVVFQNQRSFGPPPGQNEYTSANTYSWTAPDAVESVCVVCVGAGRPSSGSTNGAGALSYKNDIAVTPGSSYTIIVPANGSATRASFNGDSEVSAGCNAIRTGDGGGNGSDGSGYSSGGAGGYAGNGGGAGSPNGSAGSGGGSGGGGFGYNGAPEQYGYTGGGGTGLQGQGSNGAGGTGSTSSISGGKGGSGGGDGASGSMSGYLTTLNAGSPGGQGYASGQCKPGAVRVIWGSGRAFPSTNTADV